MKFKLFLITLLSFSLLGSTLSIGNDLMEKIEARLDGALNFNVDGEAWFPKDVDGSDLTPIVYNNRTYIPVRSLLEHKGAGVDYEADTRTVVLDFTKIETTYKPIDKSSPLIFDTLTTTKPNDDGSDASKETTLTFSRNPDYLDPDDDGDGIPTTLSYTYDLNDAPTIYVDGKMVELSLDELVRSKQLWQIETGGQVQLSYNPEADKAITGLSIATHGDGTVESDELARKIDIEIEISGPPFKIKITFKF